MALVDSNLSPELRKLCEQASHEQDGEKVLQLVKRINAQLDMERKPTQSENEREEGHANSETRR